MKTVFLDSAVINPGDISWEGIENIGEFHNYKRTSKEEIIARAQGAEVIFTDAAAIDGETMKALPTLKFIGIAATGFNHVDIETAKELGIAVANVPAYSTDAVAQQAIALLLALTNGVEIYNNAVAVGEWQRSEDYTFVKTPVTLLSGKSIGIIGYGNIGKKVAQIADVLGMTVNVYSRDKETAQKSDVVSLHCPLTEKNAGMIDRNFICGMKDGAILINTARGGLIDEEALADALNTGKLAGAGLDVLAKEPPREGNPLIGARNCLITPHIGFIPVETRRIVIETCAENLKSFIDGGRLNRIV